MPYEFENTTPVNEVGEEETSQPFPNVYDKAYETVRPTCHFDLKKIDFYSSSSSIERDQQSIEETFTRVGVTYDYFEDYEKWSHVTDIPPYPLDSAPVEGQWSPIPIPNSFTDVHQSYGFNYSSKMGIGNRKYNWLSHTDLELETFKIIKNDIREPILRKVKEAKQRQDIMGACRIQKYLTKRAEEREEQPPTFPEIKFYQPKTPEECSGDPICQDEVIIVDCFAEPPEQGYPEDCPASECQDWGCSKLESVINSIPLECELILDKLGPEYQGVNLDRYWWDGWSTDEGGVSATKSMLDSFYSGESNITLPEGVSGITFSYPTSSVDAKAPYQDVIGSYRCSGSASDVELLLDPDKEYPALDGVVKRPAPPAPFYGFFGGYTANACGCLEVDTGELDESLPDYISKCSYPTIGERFTEYLQYIASEDVRYWNTPYETPLYRKAQMQLLMSSEIEIEVPGDFNVKVGSIIKTVFPVSMNVDSPAGDSAEENQMNGKWLVVKIKHIFQAPSLHKMRITCVRDSKHIEPSATDIP